VSLKVLFVIESLGHGGAERSLTEMLPALMRAGLRPTVAFFNRSQQSLEGVLRHQGARLEFLPQRGLARRIWALRRLIQADRPDVIHTALFTSDVIGRIASIGQRAAVVSSLVNMNYDRIRLQNKDINPLKLWAVRQIDAWTARHLTTHLHAVSEPVKTAAIEALSLPPQHITVIERGRNARFEPPTANDRASARRALDLADSDEVIVTVGRQEYQKGQRYLVEAMAEVIERRPHAVLLLAGSRGRHSQILHEILQRRGLKERVRLLGHCDNVPQLLAAADVFAFPSLYEGAAGAVLEAMAVGLPIVASRIPSLESVVEEGNNGILVDRASVAPVAAAIVELLTHRDRAGAFGRRSREIFEERFTLERCAERMVQFYQALAARNIQLVGIQPASAARCE
jgi:glycosyltransferase involved in cell wall biosynthesis